MKARRHLHPFFAVSALLIASAGTAGAQSGGGKHDPVPEARQELTHSQASTGGEELHEEMFDLIRKIEKTLGRIDGELNDASAGDAPLATVDDSGIKDLLLSTRQEMQSVVDGIDRIFEIRDHHKGGGT